MCFFDVSVGEGEWDVLFLCHLDTLPNSFYFSICDWPINLFYFLLVQRWKNVSFIKFVYFFYIIHPIFIYLFVVVFFIFTFVFYIFRPAPMACGGSQARGWIRAVAASLCHSHSNERSEPHVRTTPEFMAMPDP